MIIGQVGLWPNGGRPPLKKERGGGRPNPSSHPAVQPPLQALFAAAARISVDVPLLLSAVVAAVGHGKVLAAVAGCRCR